MDQANVAQEELHSRTVRITPKKLIGLAAAGLLFPLYFVMSSDRFRPSQWSEMFWVVGGLLWLAGLVGACALYFGAAHLLLKYKATKS